MKIFLKGLNSCTQRRQNLLRYGVFMQEHGHELTVDPAASDVIILWTCAFRRDVERNSLLQIHRFEQEFGSKVVVVGCLPDIAPSGLREHFTGRVIPWREEALKIEELIGAPRGSFARINPVFGEAPLCDDAAAYGRSNPRANVTFHDQYIKLVVAEGCPFECAYCTERLAFPCFRSFPVAALVRSLRAIIDKGVGRKSVMLIADCLGEYGRDIGVDLPSLMRSLKGDVPDLRFALNNLHPWNVLCFLDDMERFLRDRWIDHVNLPIQSASNAVLERMNRRYTRSDLDRIFGMMLSLDFRDYDTHIIIGFPGETDADFEATLEFLVKYKPRYVLMSRYFEAENAPSAKLQGKVDPRVLDRRSERARRILAGERILCNWEGSELGEDRLKRINTER